MRRRSSTAALVATTLVCGEGLAAEEDLPPPPPPPSVETTGSPWLTPDRSPDRSRPPAARRPKRKRILISDFRTQAGLAPELGRTLADVAVREVSGIEGVQVITKSDLVARLGVEHSRQMLGCAEDGSCLAELAGALDAEQSLGGSIAVVDGGTLLTVTLVDMRQVTTLRTGNELLRGQKIDELVDACRRLTHEVITGRPLDATGTLDIEVAEPGTIVLLDGEDIGDGPLSVSRRVPPGKHRLVVEKEGRTRFASEVRVEPSGRTTVRPTVEEPKPRRRSGPFWYGQVFAGPPDLSLGVAGEATYFECTYGPCKLTFGGRLGVELTPSVAVEAWYRTIRADMFGKPRILFTTRLAGVAALFRRGPVGLRLSVGGGRGVTQESATGGSVDSVSRTDLTGLMSAELVVRPRVGPLLLELSLGLGLLAAGDRAPPSSLLRYVPLGVALGFIFPSEDEPVESAQERRQRLRGPAPEESDQPYEPR